jgi:hypothetical protein
MQGEREYAANAEPGQAVTVTFRQTAAFCLKLRLKLRFETELNRHRLQELVIPSKAVTQYFYQHQEA